MTRGRGWPDRLWRSNNKAAIARGEVPGSKPFSMFGEISLSGSATDAMIWETGIPCKDRHLMIN